MKNRTRTRTRRKAALERPAYSSLVAFFTLTGRRLGNQIRNGKDWRPTLKDSETALLRELSILMQRAAIAGAEEVKVSLPERKAAPQPSFVDRYTIEWIKRHAAKRVTQISKTTAKAIRREIIDGTRSGRSTSAIAKRIEKATAGQIGKIRARRIARTETHTAFERGSFEQALGLKRLGLDIVSEWAAVEDQRTRPAHAEADGQIVSIGRPFTVGGEPMRFPGDPRASARNVVNCRCSALYYVRGSR